MNWRRFIDRHGRGRRLVADVDPGRTVAGEYLQRHVAAAERRGDDETVAAARQRERRRGGADVRELLGFG
jgi:hypothetical protein